MLNRIRVLFLAAGVLLVSAGFVFDSLYVFPLKTHRLLSGTFGELRSNHFHSGIDVKVGGRVGDPILAIDDAYVYRLKTSPYGYGNAVYLKHPDGKFSVYGHLEGFNQQISDTVEAHQYKERRFPQEIYLEPGAITVRKGEVIGYAGNSGYSLGPHLHFEIRDAQERILNPLPFFPGEIRDNIKPSVQEIAFQPLNAEARVMGYFDKYRLFPSPEAAGNYVINRTIKVQGPIGIEYRGFDLLNGAPNHCGINQARLWLDDSLIYSFNLERFAFDETRLINVHLDYAYFQAHKKRFERAYVADGNRFSGIDFHRNRGVIVLNDDLRHYFQLELSDAYGNTTRIRGVLERDRESGTKPIAIPASREALHFPAFEYEVRHNVLKVKVQDPDPAYLEGLYVSNQLGITKLLAPAYREDKELVFLRQLRGEDYPLSFNDQSYRPVFQLPFAQALYPRQNNFVQHNEVHLYFPYGALVDTMVLAIKDFPGDPLGLTTYYQVGDKAVPLMKSFEMSFPLPPDINTQGLCIAQYDEKDDEWSFVGRKLPGNGRIEASSRSFGIFSLQTDVEGPALRPLNFYNGQKLAANVRKLRIKAEDDFAGIDSYALHTYFDGEWILTEYSAIRDYISVQLPANISPGAHELQVQVQDELGNRTIETYTLNF